MTIGLVLYPVSKSGASGLGRMAYALAEQLVRRHPEHRFLVFTKGSVREPLDFGASNVEVYQGSGIFWLDRLLRRTPRADVYYFSTPMLPFLWTPRYSVAVVQDFAYLSPYTDLSFYKKELLRFLQRRSLRRASKVIAISQFTKAEAVRLMGISEEKTTVVPIAVSDVCAPQPEPFPVPEPFLLYAGGMKERKNVKNIVRAFAEALPRLGATTLVLTGGAGGSYGKSVQALAQELGVASRILFAGVVAPGKLSYLYARARGFVFPSRLEGFGMAPLEAMACGLPTISSNTTSLPEVVGDAALLVDPEDVHAIAEDMVRLCNDESLRADLIARGRARAAQFSWQKSADETHAVLESVAADARK